MSRAKAEEKIALAAISMANLVSVVCEFRLYRANQSSEVLGGLARLPGQATAVGEPCAAMDGEDIRRAMKKVGLTPTKVGKALGLTSHAVNKAINGRMYWPYAEQVIEFISGATGIPVSSFPKNRGY